MKYLAFVLMVLFSFQSLSAEKAVFAGGCFWCMEPPFEKEEGVISAVSGYIGGKELNPTYKQVAGGKTGHTEAVEVTYDPKKISYEKLLEIFWQSMDPTDADGQFVDRGKQYRPGVFYLNEEQKKLAEASKKLLEEAKIFSKPIVTEITKAGKFWPAEGYHQDYYKTNPVRYKFYRFNSGRDSFLKSVWGKKSYPKKLAGKVFVKPGEDELKKTLNKTQFFVTQKDGTEPPFRNEFWDNKKAGIYVDIVSGEALFSSKDKFKSGTGWPSFTRPLEETNIVEKTDFKIGYPRTEVRSKLADSHLGHVFKDGPQPTGLRYCINSAALRFIPAEKLNEEGYGKYAILFSNKP